MIGNQPEAAGSRLSMAELSIEEGRLRDAEAPVREAREVFRKQKLIKDEVDADTVLARALLARQVCGSSEGNRRRDGTLCESPESGSAPEAGSRDGCCPRGLGLRVRVRPKPSEVLPPHLRMPT